MPSAYPSSRVTERVLAALASVLLLISQPASALERLTAPCIADTWVEAPPWDAVPPSNSEAADNHGSDPELVIRGRVDFGLLQFDLSAAKGLRIETATLRVHPKPGPVPLTMIGISTISGSGAWAEGTQKTGGAAPGSANYFFARAGQQPWAYQGSDLSDVTFGPGGSLYSYVKPRPADDGWYEIDVPAPIVAALATGDQFGLMLTDEKGQTRARHVLSSREGLFPPVLIVEGTRSDRTVPGRVRSLGTGRGVVDSSPVEARALGRTTLRPGSAILHFGGAGSDRGRGVATRYELRYAERPVDQANFDSATPVPRWEMNPLAPKSFPLATSNSLQDKVSAVVEQLQPGQIYYFAARAGDGAGNWGPVSPLGRYRAYARSFPSLPASPAAKTLPPTDGAAPDAGSVRIWAVPDLLKINPKTGDSLEQADYPGHRAHNPVWDAATATVKLAGARNEFVAFQLAIESAEPLRGIQVSVSRALFAESKLPEIFKKTGPVQLYREWFVPDDKISGEERPWYPDPLVPLNGAFDLPASDNIVPGQTVQPIFVDIYIPHGAAPGAHQGSLSVRAGSGMDRKINVEVEVLPLTLPDELNFVVDLNGYGGVNSGYDIARGTPEYRKLLRAYHRLAHLNRTNLDILGYSHSGTVEPDQAPPLEGEGANTRITSWKDWDEHFGPLLDGSAFADLPRASVPITNMYLALFENWPGKLHESYKFDNFPRPNTTEEYWQLIARHGLEAGPIEEAFTQEYQDRFSAVARQFAEHLRERHWTRTKYLVYFNDKYFYKDPARNPRASGVSWWLLDEPNHRDDIRALSFFAYLTKRWLKDYSDVPITLRTDVSYIDFLRDLLAGQIDLDVTSRHFYTKNRYVLDNRNRFGREYWNYASTNHPRDSNVSMRSWCWRAWVAGADGIVPWNTVRGMEAWDRAEPLTVFYVGKKFGANEPFASLRLKAYRRGQQDVEYLVILAHKRGWDREAATHAVANALDLRGDIKQQFEDDAGVIDLAHLNDSAFDNLCLRVAAALLSR